MTRNIHEPSLYRTVAKQESGLRRLRHQPSAFKWWTPDCNPLDPSDAAEGCSGAEPALLNGWAQPAPPLEKFAFRMTKSGELEVKGHLDSSGASFGTVAFTLPGANVGEVDFVPPNDTSFVHPVFSGTNLEPALFSISSTTGEVTISQLEAATDTNVSAFIGWYSGLLLPANDWYAADFDWEEAFVTNAANGIIVPFSSGFGVRLPLLADGATAGTWLIDVNATFFNDIDGPAVPGDWFGLQLLHYHATSWNEFDSATFQPADMITTHVWDHDFDHVVYRFRGAASLDGYFSVEIGNFCGTKQMWLDSLQMYVSRLAPGMNGQWTFQ
ncbi:MAG: hypothetical protein KatS3mg015_2454 [Fimbriimonadales bacterium]|nr:MAG: hypothetical protein KatS3mg015_2454 [Fimbriimonadales bacterium]